ncbi:MAG: TIR domain-containing protein [Neomegalonema sp.]|nr:TIR domain-containing protein [Neomegalonema sp.]
MVDEAARGRVFISYSRKDLAAAERLRDELIARGVNAYLDKHDIAPGEPWRERIGKLIASAEKILFLISKDSVSSPICDWEVNEAERQAKPIIPMMIRETPLKAPPHVEGAEPVKVVPPRLQRLNILHARDAAELEAVWPKLTEALLTDLTWEREKTDLNNDAEKWDKAKRPSRLLIWRDTVLRAAERWRDSRPANALPPTETQLDFISESRRAFSRRQTFIRIGLAAIALLMTAAAGIAIWQRGEAVEQTAIAERERETAVESLKESLRTDSRMLAQMASEHLKEGAVGRAISLARLALPLDRAYDDRDGLERPLVLDSLRPLAEAGPKLRERRIFRGHTSSVLGAEILADGRILSWSGDNTLRLWSAKGAEIAVLKGHRRSVLGAEILADGRILSWSDDSTLRLWSDQGAEIAVLKGHRRSVLGAEILADGRILSWSDDSTLRIWPRSYGQPYEWAGEVIARLKPLVVSQQCAAFQLSEKVCRLVGGDVIAIDAVEALLRLGRKQLAKPDAAAAERAFTAALELPGERRYDRLQQLYYPDQDFSAATAAARRAEVERRIAEIRKGGG